MLWAGHILASILPDTMVLLSNKELTFSRTPRIRSYGWCVWAYLLPHPVHWTRSYGERETVESLSKHATTASEIHRREGFIRLVRLQCLS